MNAATVAAPQGNQFGVLLAIFLVITFTTVVVYWNHERRMDRNEALVDAQLATLAGRIQSLADFLEVDINDAIDDSPQALAEEPDTEEFEIAPATVPDGMPLAVQSVLLRPSPVPRGKSAEWVEAEIEAMRARNAERMARAITEEAS